MKNSLPARQPHAMWPTKYHSTMTEKGTPSSHATIYRIDNLRVMRQQSPRQCVGDDARVRSNAYRFVLW